MTTNLHVLSNVCNVRPWPRRNHSLAPELEKLSVLAGFRYGDDFLLCIHFHKGATVDTGKIVSLLRKAFQGLQFTSELPEQSTIRFLDLHIPEGASHTCRGYMTRGDKDLMRCDLGHSKLVKRSVAHSAMMQSIRKS